MNELTHLSLFTGIGGIDLAAEWAGFRTAGQVEQNPYALRVLRKRFGRRIPRWTDIKDFTADDFKRRTGIDSPTLISGGFPCQPFSCAGKRRGKEDDRYLWPEMFRIVRELRPAWVLGENVAGIVNMELESCCSDLESEGYTVRAFLIPACGVGAWHRRERVFIVAYPNTGYNTGSTEQECKRDISKEPTPSSTGQISPEDVAHSSIKGIRGLSIQPGRSQSPNPHPIWSGEALANTNSQRLPESTWPGLGGFQEEARSSTWGESGGGNSTAGFYWSVEPAVGRVAHGVPHRVDRLRCLGNAVVPQQVYPILAAIAQIEKNDERA